MLREHRSRIEYAANGAVHPDVLEDLKAVKTAEARGELRGLGSVEVIRDANGRRRVVPASSRRAPATPSPRPAPTHPARLPVAPRARPRRIASRYWSTF
jgi:hypothetical protein